MFSLIGCERNGKALRAMRKGKERNGRKKGRMVVCGLRWRLTNRRQRRSDSWAEAEGEA